ncbi:MAG: aldehyde dehydrogenase family protein, partial [Burkholderiales bacterium]|nr:aldehyde dehydrogenase family protein [Burkholderiales bacterium]
MYIGGRFTDGTAQTSMTRRSPGHGTPVAQWPAGTAEDAQAAVAAARQAFDRGPWPRLSAGERSTLLLEVADLIEQHADELGLIECLETGKPIAQARGEVRG